MQMEKILNGVRQFQRDVYPRQQEFFEGLSRKQQRPMALFITCSDSRVNPNLITQTEPGDLFLLRNAGNFVPSHGAAIASGEAATIEYSIEVLGIKHIIICGHSQCGALAALLNPEKAASLSEVPAWFRHAEATRRIVKLRYSDSGMDAAQLAQAATEQNVLVQMNNLSTHPCVAARLSADELQIHGWYYDIGTGRIRQFDQEKGQFAELDGQARSTATMPMTSVAST